MKNKSITIVLSTFILAIVVAVLLSGTDISAASKYDSQRKQHNSQHSSFNYDGNRVVRCIYDYKSQKTKLYYSNSLKKKGKAIAKVGMYGGGVYLKGNYIFYLDTAKKKIIRCSTNGRRKKTIVEYKDDEDDVTFTVHDNLLIYYVKGELYICNIDGSDKKLIDTGVKRSYYADDKNIYYVSCGYLSEYNYDESTKKIISYIGIDKVGVLEGLEGNNLYYSVTRTDSDYLDNVTVYKRNLATNKEKLIADFTAEDPIHTMLVVSGKVCLLTGTGAGNGFGVVKGNSIIYKPYYKKYELGGEEIVYYKNNIAIENLKLTNKGYEHCGYCKMLKI